MPVLTKKPPIKKTSLHPIEMQIIGPKEHKQKVLNAIRSYGFKYVSESVRLEKAFPDFSAADAIVAARERSGMTQKQLSDKTGISCKTISSIENGKKEVDKLLAQKLAHVFELDYRIFLNPNEV